MLRVERLEQALRAAIKDKESPVVILHLSDQIATLRSLLRQP